MIALYNKVLGGRFFWTTVYMDLYDASLPLMRYCFPQVGADLR